MADLAGEPNDPKYRSVHKPEAKPLAKLTPQLSQREQIARLNRAIEALTVLPGFESAISMLDERIKSLERIEPPEIDLSPLAELAERISELTTRIEALEAVTIPEAVDLSGLIERLDQLDAGQTSQDATLIATAADLGMTTARLDQIDQRIIEIEARLPTETEE